MTAAPVTSEDLCLHAMHLLDASEMARLEEFLARSSEARDELKRIRGDLALLAFTVQTRPISPGLRQRVLREVALQVRTVGVGATNNRTLPEVTQPLADELVDVPSSRMVEDPVAEDSYTPSGAAISTVEEPPPTISASRSFSSVWVRAGCRIVKMLTATSSVISSLAQRLQDRLRRAEAKAARAADNKRQTDRRAKSAGAVVDALGSSGSQHFVLAAKDGTASPSAHVVYSPERGALVLQASNLQPLTPGKTYVVWLFLAQRHTAPEKLGAVQPDAQGFASLAVSSVSTGVPADHIGISVEDEDDMHTGPPTIIVSVSR